MTANNYGTRTANARRNIIYGFFQVIVSQALPFVTRTILIYRFGASYLGLNSLFASVLSVLSLMELGFGTAVVYSMYGPAADGDTELMCAYLAYYRRIYRVIGFAILVAGLLLMPFLRFFIHDKALPGGLNLMACYLIFLSDAAVSYFLYGYMTSIPSAFQRRDILSRVDMAMNLFKCVVSSVILLYSNDFYIYLISIPFITVIRNLVIAMMVRRRYPELVCRGSLDTERKKILGKKVYGLMIEKVTSVSRNSIDTLCISAYIGLSVTGIYNNYYYVMTAIISFSTMLLGSMMAGVGNSIATESREKNYSDMRMFDFIYTMVAGWVTTCLLCMYQPFMRIWLGEDMMFDMPVVLGICAYFYILKSGDIRWVYHEGKGLWYESRFIMIGEAAVNIVLNILLCRALGVLGIVLATVISVFITNFFFCPNLLFKIYFRNGRLHEYMTDHALYTLTMAITAYIAYITCNSTLPITMAEEGIARSIVLVGGRLAVCTALSAMIFVLLWNRSRRYHRALGWIRRVLA